MAVLAELVQLLAVQELHRNLIPLLALAAAAVAATHSREPMAATVVPVAAAEDHSVRAINQLEEQAFPEKAARVAAAILETTQAAYSAVAAAVVPAR